MTNALVKQLLSLSIACGKHSRFNVLFMCRCTIAGASPGFGRGGARNFIFQIWKFACREPPCALLGGFGGMLPRENFFKWCNLVRFGVYFDHILSLKIFKNYHFLYKKIKNCNFLYKRINILDTRLLWGNYSREEIF